MIQKERYGPWALITGASSGLGRGFAEHLAAAGFDVVLASRSTDRLRALGADLSTRHGVDHRAVTVDLADPDGAEQLAAATADLDVGLLISNAGTGEVGDLLNADLSDLRSNLILNARSHLDLVHHVAPRLVARGRGGILLVSALGGLHGVPHMANDSAAKGYVLNLGEALHHELASSGVDVTVLLPGAVDTPVIDKLGLDLPIAPQPVAAAVMEALRALQHRRAVHIPGRKLRTISRLTPRWLSVRMNGRMVGLAARRKAERRSQVPA